MVALRAATNGASEELLPLPAAHHVSTLVTACREAVSACEALQCLVPVLPLTSAYAKNVHELIYTVGTVETVLHQFIDRELLQALCPRPPFRRPLLSCICLRAPGSS